MHWSLDIFMKYNIHEEDTDEDVNLERFWEP